MQLVLTLAVLSCRYVYHGKSNALYVKSALASLTNVKVWGGAHSLA